MKTWHIRVVRRDGGQLTQAQALARYLLSWLWFLPPLGLVWLLDLDARFSLLLVLVWIVFWSALARLHKDRQFPHDVMARTRLISSAQDQAAARKAM